MTIISVVLGSADEICDFFIRHINKLWNVLEI